jgi:hypothetical protein
MNLSYEPLSPNPAPVGRRRRNAPNTFISLATVGSVLSAFLLFLPTSTVAASSTTTIPVFKAIADPQYPVGSPDPSEPSGEAPPAADALAGYSESYVNDFTSSSLPAGWDIFTGIPGGDPGAHFGGSHVVFGGGLLQLNTYRNPSWHNRWVTGGLCQCGLSQTYGAYFVRSRVTAAGPNEVELLWPTTNTWPPEIDFNESGGINSGTSSSVHSGALNHIDHRWLRINLTTWHTWGVIWTPTSVIYTVDGQTWSTVTVTSEIPRKPMTLDLEQRTKCSVGTQCPTHPVSMQVDWVAEYTDSPPNPATSAATTTTTTTTPSPSTSQLIAHA